jgi:hypothetical protein
MDGGSRLRKTGMLRSTNLENEQVSMGHNFSLREELLGRSKTTGRKWAQRGGHARTETDTIARPSETMNTMAKCHSSYDIKPGK